MAQDLVNLERIIGEAVREAFDNMSNEQIYNAFFGADEGSFQKQAA